MRCTGALLLALGIAAAATPALPGELAGLGIIGPLSRDLAPRAERTPREARIRVDRARRALAGDSSIEADRLHRRLDDIDRDAGRVLRRRSLAEDLAAFEYAPERFPPPDLVRPPYADDIRNEDAVIGTAKAHLRPGRLRQGPAPAPAGPIR